MTEFNTGNFEKNAAELKRLFPERCQGCHMVNGCANNFALDVALGEIGWEEALHQANESARDIGEACLSGLIIGSEGCFPAPQCNYGVRRNETRL